jgi:RNA polymerase sigma factor (sigma-70 family)
MSQHMQSVATAPGQTFHDYPLPASVDRARIAEQPAAASHHAATTLTAAITGQGTPNTLLPEATVELLQRVRNGDDDALDKLLQRCIPALRRWARGRLPRANRGMLETADVIQDTVLSALGRLDGFESRHRGALLAYLRMSVMNRIRDLARQQRNRPQQVEFPEQLEDKRRSPHSEAEWSENMTRFEAALQRLSAPDRDAIVGRIQREYTYPELAVFLKKPTEAAARMAVARAMKRLALEMRTVSTPFHP